MLRVLDVAVGVVSNIVSGVVICRPGGSYPGSFASQQGKY